MRELTPFVGVLFLVGLLVKYWWVFLIVGVIYGAYRYQTYQDKKDHRPAAAIADESPSAMTARKTTPDELLPRDKQGRKSADPVRLTAVRPAAAARRSVEPGPEADVSALDDKPTRLTPVRHIHPDKDPNVTISFDTGRGSHVDVYYDGPEDEDDDDWSADDDDEIDMPVHVLPYANLTRVPTGWPADQAVYTAVDLETTGLDPAVDRIVEIGLVKFSGDGTVLDEFSTLVNNPGSSLGARGVHNIDDADLVGAPSTADVLREAFAFMAGTVVVSHKWEFEEGFLAAAAQQTGILLPNVVSACTWRTARRQLDGRGYSAKILYKSATGEFQNDAHTALADARAVRRILLWLMYSGPRKLYLTEEPPAPQTPPSTGGDCLISCRPAPLGRASMSELIAAFPQSPHPRAGDPDEVENYLALIAECVEDGRLTYEETRALTQQAQRTRMTGTQIRYVHQLAWESQFPDHDQPLADLDPTARRERYLMAEALGLDELANEIHAVIAECDEPPPDPAGRYLRGLRIGIVGETTELVELRGRAVAHGAKLAVKITKTVQWMATVTPDATDAAHNAARRFGVVMVTPMDGATRLDEAIRDAELKALDRQREIDRMEAERQAYRDESEAYWRPVWRPVELDYDPKQEWY